MTGPMKGPHLQYRHAAEWRGRKGGENLFKLSARTLENGKRAVCGLANLVSHSACAVRTMQSTNSPYTKIGALHACHFLCLTLRF